MEAAKKELQSALKLIRGRRIEGADLEALVQVTVDETKAKAGGACITSATWEYLLRTEILTLAVRFSSSRLLLV